MTHTRNRSRWKRRLFKVGVALRNSPLAICCFGLAVSIEVFAATNLMAQTPGLPGMVEAAICFWCGMLALVASGAATALKHDPRPKQRERAGWTRVASLALLVPSIFYTGLAFARVNQIADYQAFKGSPAEAALIQMATGSGEYVDSQVRLQAANELQSHAYPVHATPQIAETLWAALILVLNAVVFGAAALPKPETETEFRHRMTELDREERRRQRREQRERNRKNRKNKNRTFKPDYSDVPNVAQLLRNGRA